MFKNFRDKMALSGISVLSIGVALLIFTFVSACGFLTQSLSIVASSDLVRTFSEALAPLIATCIRLMYLGTMGWVASLMTIRGVTLLTHTPQLPPSTPQQQSDMEQSPQPQMQPKKPKKEKAKEEEPKQPEQPRQPEIVVIPPEAAPESKVSNA
jgi:hypothetical protein